MDAGRIAALTVTHIVIAHRPALLARADRVVNLEDGVLGRPERPRVNGFQGRELIGADDLDPSSPAGPK